MRILFGLCLILAGLGPADSQETAQSLKAVYESQLKGLDRPLEDLTQKYLDQLKTLQDSAQKSGGLKQVLAIRAEVNSLMKLNSTGQQAGTFPELSRLRRIYHREKAKRERQKLVQHKALLTQYKGGLESLVQNLTRENKIDEATGVGTEIERVAGMVASIVPPSVLAPNGVVPGVVRVFGKVRVTNAVPGLEKLDASPLAEFSDFVEVKGTSIGFLARRANGDVLNHTGTVIARNIRRLMVSADNTLGIDGDGKAVVVFRGGVPKESQGITQVCFGYYRALFLRADGSLHWQGGVYTRAENKRAEPPLPARTNLKSIAMLGGTDFALTRNGKVISWNHQSEVLVPQALEKGIEQMHATNYNVLFVNRDLRVLDHKGAFLKGPEIPARVTAILTGGEMMAFRDFNGHWSVLARRNPFLGEIDKLEQVLNSRSTQDVTFHQRVGAKEDKDRAAYVIWIEASPG